MPARSRYPLVDSMAALNHPDLPPTFLLKSRKARPSSQSYRTRAEVDARDSQKVLIPATSSFGPLSEFLAASNRISPGRLTLPVESGLPTPAAVSYTIHASPVAISPLQAHPPTQPHMAVPNFSRRVLAKQPAEVVIDHDDLSLHLPAITRGPARTQGIKRWNGHTRTFSDWDGLRRVSSDMMNVPKHC